MNLFKFRVIVCCLLAFLSLHSFVVFGSSNPRQDVVNQTNQFRKSTGLPPLVMREELNAIAQQHSVNMATGRIALGHHGFGKRNAMANQQIRGLHNFAENVASGANSAAEVVTMWKNSAGHRRNMQGHYKYIGIGIATDKHGQIFYTEVFAG